jgi:hypothetical protein
MSLSFIGALLALLPPSLLKPKTEAEIERLREEERRDRELANAVSALAVEKLVSAHWRDEAKRLATQNRVDREMYERLIQQAHERFRQEGAQQMPANMRGAQQPQALANLQMAQQAQQGLYGFCNCVPGRHQVFEAERQRALMSEYQPAPVDDIVARLRP